MLSAFEFYCTAIAPRRSDALCEVALGIKAAMDELVLVHYPEPPTMARPGAPIE
jgi:hypothetical protein